MYAITFDMDTRDPGGLGQHYPGLTYHGACNDIKKVLKEYGFEPQQGSVYFGNDAVDAVTCVMAVQDLTSRYPWFSLCVTDIRMLRIEANNDLMPAVDRAVQMTRGNRP